MPSHKSVAASRLVPGAQRVRAAHTRSAREPCVPDVFSAASNSGTWQATLCGNRCASPGLFRAPGPWPERQPAVGDHVQFAAVADEPGIGQEALTVLLVLQRGPEVGVVPALHEHALGRCRVGRFVHYDDPPALASDRGGGEEGVCEGLDGPDEVRVAEKPAAGRGSGDPLLDLVLGRIGVGEAGRGADMGLQSAPSQHGSQHRTTRTCPIRASRTAPLPAPLGLSAGSQQQAMEAGRTRHTRTMVSHHIRP